MCKRGLFTFNLSTWRKLTRLTAVYSNSGGATQTKPRSGWASRDLENIFSASNETGLRRPGPTPQGNGGAGGGQTTNTGAVAGGAVGGVVGFVLIIVVVWFVHSRSRSRKAMQMPQPQIPPELHDHDRQPTELPAQYVYELQSPYQSQHQPSNQWPQHAVEYN
jgi:hypothetical protein